MKTSVRLGSIGILMVAVLATVAILGTVHVFADSSPNGPGQPGTGAGGSQPTSCSNYPTPPTTQQNAAFGSGQASSVYAGNPNTASSNNANSPNAVSQYDIACFQQSQPHP